MNSVAQGVHVERRNAEKVLRDNELFLTRNVQLQFLPPDCAREYAVTVTSTTKFFNR